MTYALGVKLARRRALAGSLVSGVAAIGPVVLGLVLLVRTGAAIDAPIFVAVVAALCVLALARVLVAFGRMRRELESLEVDLRDDGLEVKTRRNKHHVPRASIERIVEYPGSLGGLRLELAPRWDGTDSAAAYLDVPRGGEGFGELRAALASWRPVEAPRRRGRLARVVIGALVVLGLFFVPFVVDDLKRSPMVAGVVVLGGWLAMRWVLRR